LTVLADGEPHELGPGQLMAVAPGLPHSIRAVLPSEMLLTIHQSLGDATLTRKHGHIAENSDAEPLFGRGATGARGPLLVQVPSATRAESGSVGMAVTG
jgi:hypothetical protein